MIQELIAKVASLEENGGLLPAAAKNIKTWLEGGFLSETSLASLSELLDAGNADELNNRFYREIAFGTGGMRGRTIGMTPSSLEKGDMDASGKPAHPGVGSNMLNEYTVVRATLGLFAYAKAYHDKEGIVEAPSFVIAHDVRHFSRFFCELAASVWTKKGGKAYIFDGPRSTPQLSFSVRHLGATCGVVITASHNPPHDNGFKAYFSDGGQVVPPNDSGIIEQVNATPFAGLQDYIGVDLDGVTVLGSDLDDAYADCVANCVVDPSVFEKADLKVVFTPIHGTGAVATVPALKKLGLDPLIVKEQLEFDSNFPTVKSPNPENSEALQMAIDLAEKNGYDLLMATDPDADRMGIAVKGPKGKMALVTGNQIGSMMAEYRISKLKEMGWIPQEGGQNCALVKTFVTSPLQDTIAKNHGIKVVNTLTGFKWIGEKLGIYQAEACSKHKAETGEELDYDKLSLEERAKLLQKYSTYYVFGGEESYGYLPNDTVRDKDANAACALICEITASLKARGKSVLEFLDEIYLKNGYFLEGLGQLVYEGAAGASKIARILETYRANPPKRFLGSDVAKFTDFGVEDVIDPDGKEVPKQDLYFVELENGYRYAVRGSGTEPKIKFYLFGREEVSDAGALEATKSKTKETLEKLKEAILADARERAES
ncbi:phospho-sugar mutase [Pelagicoccus sp. SDUM812003]|uniref:phospho-sugar mutase n=1 Tax=Pelagicoccus sp. SDUM812003 TaxID=3041267 RepID=UPI00280F52FF|nr:phospho-sugar mutase [Pelagicoccus sp. SDUM812003]MDQ8205349.1 phospho-sugar mutase [Pelagicoccus sp. SDUM812003]